MNRSEHNSGCQWVFQRLEAHLENDLAVAEAERMTTHLAGCPLCRAELVLAQRLGAELAALPALDCPDGLLEDVVAQARAERWRSWAERVGWFLRPAWQPALGLAAVLALFLALQPPAPSVVSAPSAAEIARAERQARLALAYIGRISRRTGQTVRHQVIKERVIAPIERQARAAFDPEQAM
jgi:hypothetical protein